MSRVLPSQRFRFAASIALIALLMPLPPAQAQQKSAPPSQTSQAQLEQRIKELETRLTAAEQEAKSAAMEKDYITRVQKQYETYYEKALNTQVAIVSILAIFISVVLAIAARFGFQTFDGRIDMALREASSQLRTEFTQLLTKETQALREANAAQLKALEDGLTKRITQQEEDLTARSKFQFQFAQGLAAGADKRYHNARRQFRQALEIYKSSKPRRLLDKDAGRLAARNLFITFQLENENEAQSEEDVNKELADDLYNDLEDELALVALELTWFGRLLKERKQAPSPTPAATDKPPSSAA